MTLAELSERAGLGFRLTRDEARGAMAGLVDAGVPDGEKRVFLLAMNSRAITGIFGRQKGGVY